MSSNLTTYKPGSSLAVARNWQSMGLQERRVEAARLIGDRDHEGLWNLTLAVLTMKSRKKGRLSRHTVNTYRRGVLDLLEAWKGENLLRASPDAGDAYAAHLSAPKAEGGMGYSPSTVGVKLAAARALYVALRWSGIFKAQDPEDRDNNGDPFKDVRAPADPTAAEDKRDAYTEDELLALRETAERRGQPEDLLVVLLGGHAGLRKAEMLALRWEDVRLAEGVLKVRSGKGRKARTVPLSAALSAALGGSWAPEGYVLPFRSATRLYERLDRLAFYAKLPRGSIRERGVHGLRHYAGTRMYHETHDLHAVAKFLGHSSIQTSARYAKTSQATHVQEAVSGWA